MRASRVGNATKSLSDKLSTLPIMWVNKRLIYPRTTSIEPHQILLLASSNFEACGAFVGGLFTLQFDTCCESDDHDFITLMFKFPITFSAESKQFIFRQWRRSLQPLTRAHAVVSNLVGAGRRTADVVMEKSFIANQLKANRVAGPNPVRIINHLNRALSRRFCC